MAKTPSDLLKFNEKVREEKLRSRIGHITQLEAAIDTAIEKGIGQLSEDWQGGRLRVTYELNVNIGPWSDAIESPVPEELERRYRRAGFEEFSLRPIKGGTYCSVKLVAYDNRTETEDQRLTRLLSAALAERESLDP